MKNEYLSLLACPRCHGSFESAAAVPSGKGEGLVCRACCLFFPVKEGIPVLLLDEATSWPASNPDSPCVGGAEEAEARADTNSMGASVGASIGDGQ